MVVTPRHDWSYFNNLAKRADASSPLTAVQRFAIYEDLFTLVCGSRAVSGDWERLNEWAWKEKLDARQRQVEAFRKLDQLRHARTAADDAR